MSADRRIGYDISCVLWRGKFLNPERKGCGFKNIRIRVDKALEATRTGNHKQTNENRTHLY